MTTHKLIIGLTGGIASGKTTAANFFKALGAEIIDADEIAHQLTAPSSSCLQSIVQYFGPEILNTDQQLNRKKLRNIIFQNTKDKLWLEQLLHPLILSEMKTRAHASNAPYVILVIPLLTEVREQIDFIDRILVIDSAIENQIERASVRDQSNSADIKSIIKSQTARETRLEMADDIIINNGNLEELKLQVLNLHLFYLTIDGNDLK